MTCDSLTKAWWPGLGIGIQKSPKGMVILFGSFDVGQMPGHGKNNQLGTAYFALDDLGRRNWGARIILTNDNQSRQADFRQAFGEIQLHDCLGASDKALGGCSPNHVANMIHGLPFLLNVTR